MLIFTQRQVGHQKFGSGPRVANIVEIKNLGTPRRRHWRDTLSKPVARRRRKIWTISEISDSTFLPPVIIKIGFNLSALSIKCPGNKPGPLRWLLYFWLWSVCECVCDKWYDSLVPLQLFGKNIKRLSVNAERLVSINNNIKIKYKIYL